MIASLRGEVLEKGIDFIILDVHGVGFLVSVSQQTLRAIPPVGQKVSLRIHTQVREDTLALFGFASSDEQELFGHLTTVKGVGPKLAINILGGMEAAELANALVAGDMARLTRLPGVGKRIGERLIVELKDKIKAAPLFSQSSAQAMGTVSASSSQELVSALQNLGYRAQDAERVAVEARKIAPEGADLSELVRVALKLLVSKTA